MTSIEGLTALGGALPASVDGAPGTQPTGDLFAAPGGAQSSPLDRAGRVLSELSAEAMQRPTAPGEGRLVERLAAEGPARAPDGAALDRASEMSFGEMMAGYRDLTRVTVELGVVASASSSFTTATGKLLSGS